MIAGSWGRGGCSGLSTSPWKPIGGCDWLWQGSHRDWKSWKMKVVMEMSWNMTKLQQNKSLNFLISRGI